MNSCPGRLRPEYACAATRARGRPAWPLTLGCLMLSATPALRAQESLPAPSVTLAPLRVRAKSTSSLEPNLPATVQRIDAPQLRHLNIVDSEDGLRYMPAFGIRKRFIGDENATFSVRGTSNQQSARGLVYLDGMLLSNLLNNSWSTPPRWSMAFPDHLARMEVIYGAYSALYPGNAIGATVLMTTRMPERLELSAQTQLFTQHVHLYGVDRNYGGSRQSATLGDRVGKLSFLLGVAHLQSNGQPLVYATQNRSGTAADSSAAAVAGAYADRGANGGSRVVLGVNSEGQEASAQDQATLKLAYDVTPTLRAGFTVGYWAQELSHRTESFLRDAQGQVVYAGTVAIDGRPYTLPAALFAPSNRRSENTQYGMSLQTHRESGWNIGVDASYFNMGKNQDRSANSSLPADVSGQLTSTDGSHWRTFDLRASRRPARPDPGSHWLSLGYHYDGYALDNGTYSLDNWRHGHPGAVLGGTGGSTQTQALYAQDAWRLSDRWQLTYGLRWEQWRAYGGFIANDDQFAALPSRQERHASPKAALSYQLDDWRLRLALARAYRFPTVGELFQGSFSGLSLVNNNPRLKPENDLSRELSAERDLGGGLLRMSLYRSDTRNTLFSQTDYSVFPNVTNVQNIGRIRTRGAEASYDGRAVGWDELDLSVNAAYTQATVMENRANPESVGKQFYRVPRWRANLITTWHAGERSTLTLAGRYSGRQYNTLDHSDIHPRTFGGTSAFLTWDAKWNYRLGEHWELGLGVDNLSNRRYYVYYPYPARTLYVEAKMHL